MSKFSLKKPRRLTGFICLLMGLIIIISLFTPIFKLQMDVLGTKVTTGVTGYDMIKAVIKKDHLLPESVEKQIYDIVNKADKDIALSVSGEGHKALMDSFVSQDTSKLYAYFIYYGAIAVAISALLMVLFGLLGTLIRAKFFKSCNIIFSLLALIGSALAVAGTILIAKSLTLIIVPFSYWAILMAAPALLALLGFVFIRNKR